MQQFSKWNKGFRYLLMVIDVFSKYGYSVPLKNKAGDSVAHAFQKILKEGRIPKYLWTDKGKEFYNKDLKKVLKQNNINIYSTENEEKSSVVERWNRTIKNEMWKQFTKQSSTQYLDILPDILNKYNNNYHRSIKMTPVKASKKKNEGIVYFNLYGDITPMHTKAKFEVGDTVRISKYKRKLFDKGYTPNWTEEIFLISKVLNTNPHTYEITDLKGELISGTFYEQELLKTNQNKFRIKKVIRKDYKKKLALVQWSGYGNDFNSWVPIEDLEKL